MTYTQIAAAVACYTAATIWHFDYPDKDAYISDFARSYLFVANPDNPPAEIGQDVIDTLGVIYDVCKMTLREIREAVGMSRAELSLRFHISPRTIEAWEQLGNCPLYTRLMIAECLGLFPKPTE